MVENLGENYPPKEAPTSEKDSMTWEDFSLTSPRKARFVGGRKELTFVWRGWGVFLSFHESSKSE